jgi:signal transduction histidine kinase
MRTVKLKKLFGSVFTRLLLTILVTGFLINLLVIGLFGYIRHRMDASMHAHLVQYIQYITRDLGVPPNLDRARAIARAASMTIRYTSPGENWSTSEKFNPIPSRRVHLWHEAPGMMAGSSRGRYFVKVRHGDGELLFQAARGRAAVDEIQKVLLALICLFTLVLVLAYFAIRWILKPIRWLTEGVNQVGDGHLDHRVPEERADEFRDLAEAFNDMVARISKAMHSREQLLLDVSHELRSPLTRLKIGLEMLPAGPKKESLREDIIEMEKMITDILEAARMQHNAGSLNRQNVDLAALVEALLPDFTERPPGIKVSGDLAETWIPADREKAGIALKNVIDNALKYSEKGLEPVEVSLTREPGKALVTIRDKGIGIPVEDQPYIFEPFYRADKSRTRKTGGFGLGLSMCKTIMETHGGSILLDSVVNQGTTVILTFPADT